jgi:hypothetical protein
MNKGGRWEKLIALMGILVIATFACQLMPLEDEKEVFHRSGDYDYTFDPNTIFDSLSQGNIDVFQPLVASPQMPSQRVRPADWNSDDFFLVAQAFHEFHWKEPVEDWKLNVINYIYQCEDVDNGPSSAWFLFFKLFNGRTEKKMERNVHDIGIFLSDNTILWSEVVRYPATENWLSIDLPQTNISVEEAVKIAEKNEGNSVRSGVDNKCSIGIMLAPNALDGRWQVKYKSIENDLLLEVDVNINTGDYEVFFPRK